MSRPQPWGGERGGFRTRAFEAWLDDFITNMTNYARGARSLVPYHEDWRALADRCDLMLTALEEIREQWICTRTNWNGVTTTIPELISLEAIAAIPATLVPSSKAEARAIRMLIACGRQQKAVNE